MIYYKRIVSAYLVDSIINKCFSKHILLWIINKFSERPKETFVIYLVEYRYCMLKDSMHLILRYLLI